MSRMSVRARGARLGGILLGVVAPVMGAALQSSLAPPRDLTVVSADRQAVVLRWQEGGEGPDRYVVERRTGSGAFAELAAVSGTEAVDRSADVSATYTYRVRAAAEAPGRRSAPSNEVTVGPPPAGFSEVVSRPAGSREDFGSFVALALDANDDPLIAYAEPDPDSNSTTDDARLYVVAWDRARYRWAEPVLVDTPGWMNTNPWRQEVVIARDPGSGRLGIAYQKTNRAIWLALSDDGGRTWQTEAVHEGTGGSSSPVVGRPRLALAGNTVHLAYLDAQEGIRYGIQGAEAREFAWALAPGRGGARAANQPFDLVLDESGHPVLAYWLQPAPGSAAPYTITLVAWRVGETETAVIADSNNVQNDLAAVSLSRSGGQLRAAFLLARDAKARLDALWVSASDDSGRTWSGPRLVPRDATYAWDGPLVLASDARGGAAIALTTLHGQAGPIGCGRPKVARSADFVAWATCGPDPGARRNLRVWHQAAQFAGSRLYLALHVRDNPPRPRGVWFWREP